MAWMFFFFESAFFLNYPLRKSIIRKLNCKCMWWQFYLFALFSSKVVITWAGRTFQRTHVRKMACVIQFANFSVVVFLVVERQTTTVIHAQTVATNWIYGRQFVENVPHKFWVFHGISVDIKGIVLAGSFATAVCIGFNRFQQKSKIEERKDTETRDNHLSPW